MKLTKKTCRSILRQAMGLSGIRQVLLTDDGQHATMFAGQYTEISFDLLYPENADPVIVMTVQPVDVPAEQEGSAMYLYFNTEDLKLMKGGET